MKLDQEQIKQVEEYGALLFTPEEIGIIMNLPAEEVKLQALQEQSEFKTAYLRGRLASEAHIRRSVIDLARKGSSPAQILAIQLMEQITRKEIQI